ncbi:hypothetical protein F5Y16DRAFT_396148 [Xylariaceae sp. FL0255]|nr:hypothetical protein F5Y16DRAFT_396148 [Xylariaceae sp. FL0255]
MHYLKLAVLGLTVMPARGRVVRKGCTSGTYECSNPSSNATSTVQVCSNGFWVLAAICGTDQTCVQDIAGGCVCE